jgi:DNA-binding CsgD family transcriptional regulator
MQGPQIQWPRGDGAGVDSVELPADGASVLIGRTPNARVDLSHDASVSRRHARLTCTDGEWVVEDIGSSGGTYLMRDGRRRKVTSPYGLCHGDRICVGRTILRYQAPPATGGEVPTEFVEDQTIVLTAREKEFLEALCSLVLAGSAGWPSNEELAQRFVISDHTVRTHLKTLYLKFGLRGVPDNQRRARLIQIAVDEGWVARPGG